MKNKDSFSIIYSCHSSSIELFWNLHKNLKEINDIEKFGFLVTNKYSYENFKEKEKTFSSPNNHILSEWNIIKNANQIKEINFDYISDWENKLNDGSLWNSLIIDRRLGFSLTAQFRQSYKSKYNHQMLLRILESSLKLINKHFDDVRPSAVLGLNAVTIYDYLYYLIAQKRKIPYIQLKLTRIGNYVSWFSNPYGLPSHILDSFKSFLSDGINENKSIYEEAKDFVKSSQNSNLIYEGAISKNKNSNNPKYSSKINNIIKLKAKLKNILKGFFVRDHHYPNIFRTFFEIKILRFFRKLYLKNIFDINNSKAFLSNNKFKYAFFPLNTEPEVALLAYGRPYRNQIETVRNLASSIPVGWKLIVKEHPNSFGYRKSSYYKKLKQIPNVLLASNYSDTNILIKNAELVSVVYGTIGLEAILMKKPLLTFSKCPYSMFNKNMVLYSKNPWELSKYINDLINNYFYDEHEIIAFIAAHISCSEKINLFTDLLSKKNRHKSSDSVSIEIQYKKLAEYTKKRIFDEIKRINA